MGGDFFFVFGVTTSNLFIAEHLIKCLKLPTVIISDPKTKAFMEGTSYLHSVFTFLVFTHKIKSHF